MERTKEFMGQRAELLAQLFLQDRASVWTANRDTGLFDAIAVFHTGDKKLRLIAVEVKATEQPVGKEFRFSARPEAIQPLGHANVPVLFLVVDVKRNEIFYGWASEIRTSNAAAKTRTAVSCILPVASASERKQELLDTIAAQPEFSEQAVGSK